MTREEAYTQIIQLTDELCDMTKPFDYTAITRICEKFEDLKQLYTENDPFLEEFRVVLERYIASIGKEWYPATTFCFKGPYQADVEYEVGDVVTTEDVEGQVSFCALIRKEGNDRWRFL